MPNTNEQYFNSESPLTEPHFDEEATVLSARPVVPLEEIQLEEHSRKRLLFGLAIACSLALGALCGAFVYKNSEQGASTAITEAAPGATGLNVNAPVSAIAEGVDASATGISPESEVQTSVPPVSKKPLAPVSRNSRVVARDPKTPAPPQIEQQERNWDEELYERRLRRRSERQAMRESRRRQRRPADDLWRVRDIFEGPPRP